MFVSFLIACTAAPDSGTALVGDPTAGAAIYTSNCSGCHGAAGEGASGPSLTGSDDEAAIAEIVTTGDGDMPGFESSLSAQEIADVAAYVAQEL